MIVEFVLMWAVAFPIAIVIVIGQDALRWLNKLLRFELMLLLRIKMALIRLGFRVSLGLGDLERAKRSKRLIMEKGAIKELMYGGLKEIMGNRRYYYDSRSDLRFSSFTAEGEIAVREFVCEISKFISAAENKALDERAKDIILSELKKP